MGMTKKRKSLQNKLRRKFKWSTNTNYNRGTILIKPNASTHLYHEPRYVIDIAFDVDDYALRRRFLSGIGNDVQLTLTKYDIRNDGLYEQVDEITSYISLEELELICKIAREKQIELFTSGYFKETSDPKCPE